LIVLGIDPGLRNTGWGVVEKVGSRLSCVAYGCITTEPASPAPTRLSVIHSGIGAVIARYRPDEAAVESVYFSNNAQTAFATGQARGVALLAASALPVGEYGPGEIKMAVVGTGGADKRQVQYMVRSLLTLERTPEPDHAADALATAICHISSRVVHAIERGAR